jgi:glycosyltransferase 2 family protein
MTREDTEQARRIEIGPVKKQLFHPSNIKKNLLTIIKIFGGILLLVISLQGIHWEDLVAGIRTANPGWLILGIAAVLIGLFLKVWRWAVLVRNYQVRATTTRLFSAYFVGQAVNIVLPLRGGDLVRIGFFADQPKVLPEITSTVVIEKYLDLLALTVCGIWISYKISVENILSVRSWLLPLTIALTLILVAGVIFGPAAWEKIRSGNKLPDGVIDWMDRWVKASQWLRNPRYITTPILLTILIWVVMWLTNLLLFKSLEVQAGGTASGLVLTLVYVGLFPALMPGNIGPFYFFARLALLPFGIIQDQAIIFAVILHAIVTLPALLGGLIGILVRPRQAIE